ncbi:nucleotidyltransferase domain-containing protein [Bacillus litorisediminis]|uniref:nucleotidyltransferase domain-containing protein n=1 Tax=Bacillus litorisediminis TaxID=2922713 RepID=UPI001FAFE51B|nr:nucleotidyltransferase domain-containing protein [Bacillus litorisediminis]
MGFVSKHIERDSLLPKYRNELLHKAVADLSSDPHVLAIYLHGSLAKGNEDLYSDIDLHTIVNPEKKADFIMDKRNRSSNWGEVLFFEGNSTSPVIVTHFQCFVKMDSWYHSPEEIEPSIWLNGIQVLYDPKNILNYVVKESANIVYKPTPDEVEFWRGKVLALIHETYRAVMRGELYYAYFNVDRIRWLIAYGWYMEMEQHLDTSYGVWSKVEGKRSKLSNHQLSLLESWDCSRNPNVIMKTIKYMIPEFYRLNKALSNLVNMNDNEEQIKKIVQLVI